MASTAVPRIKTLFKATVMPANPNKIIRNESGQGATHLHQSTFEDENGPLVSHQSAGKKPVIKLYRVLKTSSNQPTVVLLMLDAKINNYFETNKSF
jgi:hypothetical protein